MKQVIIVLSVLLGGVIMGYLILCSIGPKNLDIERNRVMDHPAKSVYEQIVSFQNWEHWSPWMQMDSNLQLTYIGKEGVGSSASWISEKDRVGSGTQTMVETIPRRFVLVDLEFKDQGNAQASFEITPIDDSTTKVTWGFRMEPPFLVRGFMLFVDLEEELGPMYETGLRRMDEFLDKEVKMNKEAEAKNKVLSATDALIEVVEITKSTRAVVKRTLPSFINEEEGELLTDALGNDLTNRAFEYILTYKKSGGVCGDLDLGNTVWLENDHHEKVILVRMSMVWKNSSKEKTTIYKEYEINPTSQVNVGCTQTTSGEGKVKWKVIHTAFKE